VDGVIEINQAKALAGGVTASDAPGFPVTIDVGGSYRLTGSLTNLDASVDTIRITASLVSLDLNGFIITGPLSSCTWNASSGVLCSSYGSGKAINASIGCPFGTIVRNGTVLNSANDGVDLCAASTVENVNVFGAFGQGIRVEESSIVKNCQVVLAYVAGIRAPSSLVVDSTVRDCGSSPNAEFSFGVDGGSTTVATRSLVLLRIWNNQYFRNGRAIGSSMCSGNVC
jgi:hypothetical protein